MARMELFDADSGMYMFVCPGCKYNHSFTTLKPNESNAMWQFNGDLDFPTVSPSLLVNGMHPEHRCHSFIRNGQIEFLTDCFHELAGQTVDLPEIEP